MTGHEWLARHPCRGAAMRFIVASVLKRYIQRMVSERQRIILADHARLPWRFFGQLAALVAGL
ncbi:MAG: hypothetical protein OJF62_001737 [Pseudolabrys sp.]|nr:hypothetical protein [Pseudolabrys sp.]